MKLLEIAAKLFLDKLGAEGKGLNASSVTSALQNLFPSKNGDLDLQAIVGQFMGNNASLAQLATSWLGNGANMNLSASQLLGVFGESKISEFASKIGVESNTAVSGLAKMLPEFIDKASENGALKKDIAGSVVKGLMGKFL